MAWVDKETLTIDGRGTLRREPVRISADGDAGKTLGFWILQRLETEGFPSEYRYRTEGHGGDMGFVGHKEGAVNEVLSSHGYRAVWERELVCEINGCSRKHEGFDIKRI
jgi:hypothetical protein